MAAFLLTSTAALSLLATPSHHQHIVRTAPRRVVRWPRMAVAQEYTVELTKPLGLRLEENDGGGLLVSEILDTGSAADSEVAPGDVLIKLEDSSVTQDSFDNIMEQIATAPATLSLTLSRPAPEPLGKLDITPNLAKSLSGEDAILVDQVVRAAVDEIRTSKEARRELGSLLRVEIVVGAGVRKDGQCLVRFFAIFSLSGDGSSFSCNVSATGVKAADGSIEITALSCAKDEGWGRTIDLKR